MKEISVGHSVSCLAYHEQVCFRAKYLAFSEAQSGQRAGQRGSTVAICRFGVRNTFRYSILLVGEQHAWDFGRSRFKDLQPGLTVPVAQETSAGVRNHIIGTTPQMQNLKGTVSRSIRVTSEVTHCWRLGLVVAESLPGHLCLHWSWKNF